MSFSGRGSAVTIAYDAGAGTYQVSDASGSVTMGAADLTDSRRNYDTYEKQSGTVTDELKLYGNIQSSGSQTAPSVPLTYLSFGIWTHIDSATTATRKTYLLFGFPTATAEMPRTGSASYRTLVSGHILHDPPQFGTIATAGGHEYDVNGSAIFDADFGTGAVSTTLNLQYAFNRVPIGTFVGAGAIGGNQFSGGFTSGPMYFSGGSFAGGFFGPGAGEMGYVFNLSRFNPDPYAGAAPMRVEDWIVGAVVGSKK